MPDCEVKIVPKDSIMVSVRLDWTLEEFYAANGVDNFTDRMAAVLGVHASQIKVVAVYQGSVIVEYLVEVPPEDEEPDKTLKEIQLNFYDAVVSGNLDLGAPIIDAMANGRIVKTGYDGDHYQGKDGNIWDHLVENNKNDGGNSGDNNRSEGSDNGSNTDQSGSGSNANGRDDDTTNTEKEKLISKVTETRIVTEEEHGMTDTIKYLIVFLAVLSVALVIVIGYIAMRMCAKRRMKPVKRASQPNKEFQYAGDDAKNIFSNNINRNRKINDADERQEAALEYNHQTSNQKLNVPTAPIQEGMTTEEQYVDTDRGLASNQ